MLNVHKRGRGVNAQQALHGIFEIRIGTWQRKFGLHVPILPVRPSRPRHLFPSCANSRHWAYCSIAPCADFPWLILPLRSRFSLPWRCFFLHASRRWLSKETAWILLGGIFYGSVHPWLALFLWVYAGLAAVVGKRIETTHSKTATLLFVAVAVGLLALTKYANWGLSLVGGLPLWPQWAVPASLSFITFQAIWAVCNRTGRSNGGQHAFSDRAHLFLSFSVLGSHRCPDAMEKRPHSGTHANPRRFGSHHDGPVSKIGTGERSQHHGYDGSTRNPSIASSPLLWQSVLAYNFEIYFDFAGYSIWPSVLPS